MTWICRISCDSFTLNARCDYVIPYFNLNHFYISFLVNPSSKLSNEKLLKKNVLMEFLKQCHMSFTVKEIVKAPVIAFCIRNFLKENNLMRVKNIFIIADPSNITKYKRKFKKL